MTNPGRFRFVATFIAGTPVDIAVASAGQPPYTDGQVIYVSAGGSTAQHRSEMLLQSALLGAGSLDTQSVKALRGRPATARRYLAVEGHRVLAELAGRLPLAAALCPEGEPRTASIAESLALARSRGAVEDPPEWFGVIKPSRVHTSPVGAGSTATDDDLSFDVASHPENDDGDDDSTPGGETSKILKLFEAPMNAQALSNFLRKLFGGAPSPGDDTAGAELTVGSVRRTQRTGPDARPTPTRIRFTDDGTPGASVGVGGALYPEWDVHHQRYRPDWCRVIDFPVTTAAGVSAAGVPADDVLRRRLSRVGLGPKVLRGRADGDELDIEALTALFADLRSGYSPPENVYLERRALDRNLGVLILVDASGSATDTDPEGLAVHEHQRRAAATLAMTLEELGDRVAVYAFRSHGRHAVHLPAIKTFGQRFGAVGRARLDRLQPSGYTRLGAGIRGAGEILKNEAGTPHRLMLVLSDGFPYDDGYEGRYAEADARKALDELRTEGVACLCLSIGSGIAHDAIERVFGSASHASATSLADLSPRMDELFLSALRELSVTGPKISST